jgi:Tfp pilus assembly protein PilF
VSLNTAYDHSIRVFAFIVEEVPMKLFNAYFPGLRGTILLAAPLLLLLLAGSLAAQDFAMRTETLRGQVHTMSGSLPEHLTVQVEGPGGYMLARTDVLRDGKFTVVVRDANPGGVYQLEVVEGVRGSVIHRESLPWPPMDSWLEIQLPEPKRSTPVSGFVTANQLRQDPPRKARKHLTRALKAEQAGDFYKSLEHLQNALSIYPDYIDASYQLGAINLKLRDFGQAEQAFQQTLRLDPRHAMAYCGLSLSQSGAGRLAEGEKAAREALRLHPSLAWGHYVLGIALLEGNTDPGEAETRLRRAAQEIPRARLVLARLLEGQGHKQQAAGEVKGYLDSGAADNRQFASLWLKQLRGE